MWWIPLSSSPGLEWSQFVTIFSEKASYITMEVCGGGDGGGGRMEVRVKDTLGATFFVGDCHRSNSTAKGLSTVKRERACNSAYACRDGEVLVVTKSLPKPPSKMGQNL